MYEKMTFSPAFNSSKAKLKKKKKNRKMGHFQYILQYLYSAFKSPIIEIN